MLNLRDCFCSCRALWLGFVLPNGRTFVAMGVRGIGDSDGGLPCPGRPFIAFSGVVERRLEGSNLAENDCRLFSFSSSPFSDSNSFMSLELVTFLSKEANCLAALRGVPRIAAVADVASGPFLGVIKSDISSADERN